MIRTNIFVIKLADVEGYVALYDDEKGKTMRDTQIKFYKLIGVPSLLYGSEAWIPRREDFRLMKSSMGFFGQSKVV